MRVLPVHVLGSDVGMALNEVAVHLLIPLLIGWTFGLFCRRNHDWLWPLVPVWIAFCPVCLMTLPLMQMARFDDSLFPCTLIGEVLGTYFFIRLSWRNNPF